MSSQYSGYYICGKCGWKSELVIFGYLHGWRLNEKLIKLVEQYKKEFGKEYLKIVITKYPVNNDDKEVIKSLHTLFPNSEITITKDNTIVHVTVKDYILSSHSSHWRYSYQCKKCFNIYIGIPDIVESKKIGKKCRPCPKCKSFGESIELRTKDILPCPKCKSKSLTYHESGVLID